MQSVQRCSLVLTLVLSACTMGTENHGTSMRHEVGAIEEHVTEIQSEADVHAAAIDAADMAGAMTEETRHHEALTGHADAMRDVMQQMMMCTDAAGDPPDTTHMDDALGNLLDECIEHMAMMGSAT